MWLIWDYLFLFSKNLSNDTFLKVVFENPERLILDCAPGLHPPPQKKTRTTTTNKQTKHKKKTQGTKEKITRTTE